jgi:hypothetical protein
MNQISEAFIRTPVGIVKVGKRIPVSSAAKTKSGGNRPSLSVGGTVEKGHIIKRARDSLDKKEYEAWVKEDLKIKSLQGALYRVYVSEHPILSDPKYWKHLPVDYRSLYELSLIDDDKLRDYIKQGKVHHDLGRGEATQLKRNSWDDAQSADNNSSKTKIKARLPLPTVSPALAVLRQITRYFVPDQAWKEFNYQNPRPSEIPSKEASEAALQWVEAQRTRKRGERK